MCGAMFPSYARLVFQRLLEAVERGGESQKGAAIAVMRAIFEVPGVDLGSPAWFAEDSQLSGQLSGLLGGPLASQVGGGAGCARGGWYSELFLLPTKPVPPPPPRLFGAQVLEVFEAMLHYQGGMHPDEDVDLGECAWAS